MSSRAPRLLFTLTLALGAPLAPACADPPLTELAQVPADRLEIVRGDRLLTTTSTERVAELERHQITVRGRTYEGVRLRDLLRGVGVELDSFQELEALGADGYRGRLTRDAALADTTLIVDREAGEALPLAAGPLRLLTEERAASTRALRRLRLNP